MCKKHCSAILCQKKNSLKFIQKKFHQKILIGLKGFDKYKLSKIEELCDYLENKTETRNGFENFRLSAQGLDACVLNVVKNFFLTPLPRNCKSWLRHCS